MTAGIPQHGIASPLERIASNLGRGTLDRAGDGSMPLPAGASGPDVRPAGASIVMVKDEAVSQAIADLTSEFKTFLDAQKTYFADSKTALQGIDTTLKIIAKTTESLLSAATGGGGAGITQGTGNPTAGMVTAQNISRAYGQATQVVTSLPGIARDLSAPVVPGSLRDHAERAVHSVLPDDAPWGATPLSQRPQGPPGGSQGPSSSGGGRSGGTSLPQLGGDLPGMSLLKKFEDLPGISTAVRFIRNGYDTFIKQREINTGYQQMLGGTNFDQFDVRAAEQGFRFKNMGESSTVAKQQYEDALSLGYRDNQGYGLGGFVNGLFAGHFGIGSGQATSAVPGQPSATAVASTAANLNYNHGISNDESFRMFSIMAENGAANLGQVAQSLRDVTDAAREFGVNAVAVRQKLADTFTATTDAGFRGGAAPISDILTSQVTTGGKTLQGMDPSGMVSDQMTYRYAAQSGMTHGQYLAMANSNPMAAARTIGNNVDTMIAAFIPQPVRDYINKQIDSWGGKAEVSKNESAKNSIANDVASWAANNYSLDPTVLAQTLSTQTGAPLTPDNVWYYIVNWAAGNTIAAQTKATINKNAPTKVTAATLTTQEKSLVSDMSGHGGFAGFDQHSYIVKASHREANLNLMTKGSVGAHTLNDAYGKGMQSPVLNALVTSVGNSKQMVRVNTRTGPRVMTLTEAIAQFPAEVESGQITMVGGQWDGQSVSAVTGGLVDNSKGTAAEATKEAKSAKLAAAQRGQGGNYTADYYNTRVKTGTDTPTPSSSGPTQMLGLTTQAQQLLQFLPRTAAATSGNPMGPGTASSPR